MNQYLTPLLMVLGLIILLFLATRELLLWYWKINESVADQKKTNWLLAQLLYQQGGELTEDQKKWLGFD